jgi:hypothetical protein
VDGRQVELQVVQSQLDLVKCEVYVPEIVAILAHDLLFRGRRDIGGEAFLHEAEVRDEGLEVLNLISGENDDSHQTTRTLQSFLVELHIFTMAIVGGESDWGMAVRTTLVATLTAWPTRTCAATHLSRKYATASPSVSKIAGAAVALSSCCNCMRLNAPLA